MNFTWPPIIERELRLAARRGGTYWNRVGAATAAAVVFFWVMSVRLPNGTPLQAGLVTFRILIAVAAVNVLGGVLRMTAETFAREKRQDTLGLLFLTPLSPRELVLGKLISSSLVAFSRFVAMIPLLALPLLMGAVAWQNVVLLLLAMASLTFLGATLGLFISAISWDEKRAASEAAWAMFGLVVGVPAICLLIGVVLFGRQASTLLASSPAFGVWQATVPGAGATIGYWFSIALAQLLGWLFLQSTIRILPQCWRNRPPAVRAKSEHRQRLLPKVPLAIRTQTSSTQPAPRPIAVSRARRAIRRGFDQELRAQLLDRNPVLWLAQRWRADSASAWILGSVSIVGIVLTLILGDATVLLTPSFALFACVCVNGALKLHVAIQAGFAFARDRGEDTLELLVATPLSPRALIDAHLHCIWEPLRPRIQPILWAEGLWLVSAVANSVASFDEFAWMWAVISVGTLVFLVPDLRAIIWSGLWQGVVTPKARDAQQGAFGTVLGLPWLGACIGTVAASVSRLESASWIGIILWMLFKAIVDRTLLRYSRRRLLAELPRWAQRRAAGDTEDYSRWRKVGRRLGLAWRELRRALIPAADPPAAG